jgi:hypothetical protein
MGHEIKSRRGIGRVLNLKILKKKLDQDQPITADLPFTRLISPGVSGNRSPAETKTNLISHFYSSQKS